MMGNAQRLLITQMGVWVSPSAPYTCRFRVEVYLPESAGDATDLVDLWEGNRRMFCEIRGSELSATGASAPLLPVDEQNIQNFGSIEGGSGPQSNRANIRPGEFRTVSMPIALTNLKDPSKRPEGPFYLRATVRMSGEGTPPGGDIVPLMQDAGTGQALYQVDAEIKGDADGGESSEISLRSMLPHLTSQSSVFAVYSIGQKITQLPNGRIRVLGKSRTVSLLERRAGAVSVISTQEPW